MRELIVDSFAGGGGASEGIRAATGRDPDIAVNHDALALAMHRINHPGTYHIAEDIWNVDPIGMCEGRPIGLLWMSPDCKHFSKAKGGKPREKAIRGLAWVGLKWVKSLPKWQRPRVVILENVEEFQDWGPLLEDGRPCPVQKGATFRQFDAAWRALGYATEHRELRAWRYGAPTIRKRLFWIARRDGAPIVWPAPTHGDPNIPADAAEIAAGRQKPWRTAAEIIDWSLPCPSIFETAEQIKRAFGVAAKRPLADATLARIAKGVMRYVVNAAKPFIVPVTHQGDRRVHAADDPLRTITTARRGEHALVTPFVTKFNSGSTGHRAEEPLHTVTAHASETHGGGAAPLGVVSPLLVRTAHGEADRNGRRRGRGDLSAEAPMPAVLCSNDAALVAPFLTPRYHEKDGHEPRTRSVEKPTATITGGDNVPGHLVAPMMVRTDQTSGDAARKGVHASDEPSRTITTAGGLALVSGILVPRYGERPGQEPRSRSVGEPIATIVPDGNGASLGAVYLDKQYGRSVGSEAGAPVHTLGGCEKEAIVSAFLAQHNSERAGAVKAGRSPDDPVSSVTASGGQQTIVSAYLAQHNTDMVGHQAEEPVSTIVGKGCTQGVVAAMLSHAYTSNTAGGQGSPDVPLKTVVTGGHAALVSAFLAKYYGAAEPVQNAEEPMHTVTTKPRHGLVTVTIAGQPYAIVDIGMRMLTPRERFLAQGFRPDYVIDRGLLADGTTVRLTGEQQGRMCGNSVCPPIAQALVAANYREREVRRRPEPREPGLLPLVAAE